jgi:hypothetical protein
MRERERDGERRHAYDPTHNLLCTYYEKGRNAADTNKEPNTQMV